LGKGALDIAGLSRPYGGLIKTGTYAGYGSRGEAVGKPGVAGGVYEPAFKPPQAVGRPMDDRPMFGTGPGKSGCPGF